MCRCLLLRALVPVVLVLVSCDQNTSPTQPVTTVDQPLPVPEFAWASNSWRARAPMPTGRERNAAGVVVNSAGESILYVFGGTTPDEFGDDVLTIEAYNYATDKWITKSSRFRGTWTNGVGVIGGRLYISGGLTSLGVLRTLYAYDPARDLMIRKADMPRSISNGVTGVIGGKLYVLTGVCNSCTGDSHQGSFSRRFWRYDPGTNLWSFLPWCPRVHAGGVGGVINGKFYVAGGTSEVGASSGLDMYDPLTNKWKALASMPEPVGDAGGAVLNNQLYSVGGEGPLGHWKVFAYNPVTNSWTTKAPMLTGRQWPAVATITAFGNSKILAVGGFQTDNGGSTPLQAARANEAYKP
jgi:N-acetylneuraminic acid mutarotase